MLFIGWPPGTRASRSSEARQYVRDPDGVMSAELRDRLELRAILPADARSTGYVYEDAELYLSPTHQDEAAYIVRPGSIERWPRSDPMTLCM